VAVETFGRAAHGSNHREGIDAIVKMGKVLVAVEELGRRYLAGDGHPLVGHPSIHGSIIQGGRELSTYPDHCTAQFERRTLPAEDPAGVAQEFEKLCAQLTAAVADREPVYGGSAPWLDSALLGAAGIPTVIFGPEGVGAHAAEEWVSLSSVVLGAQVLAETIVRLCG
jgi:acetylornithine deacetylase